MTKTNPTWKQLYLEVPLIRREFLDEDFLTCIPEEWWDDVVKDISAPCHCFTGFCVCETEPCENIDRRNKLEENDVRDKWGRYLGNPEFGVYSYSLEGFVPSSHGDVNSHDCEHGHTDSPIVEDLSMPSVSEGIEAWGADYLVMPDGRHGPRKFRNRRDKVRYMQITGHREKGSYLH